MSTPTPESPNTEVRMGSQEMAMLSNLLAAYTFVADQPERTALVFLIGVCIGLLVTLCTIVFQIHCRADCHYGNSTDLQNRQMVRNPGCQQICAPTQTRDENLGNADASAVVVASGVAGNTGGCEPEDWDDTCDLSARRRRRFERALLNATMFTSSEELDRAQRLEERERVLREIWMNGQPDISTVTQSLNRYY